MTQTVMISICAVACCFFVGSVYSYPFGPPLTVCESLFPIEHLLIGGSNEDLGYRLTTNKTWFSPGELVPISISLRSNKGFRGLIMQVRTETNQTVGSFNKPSRKSGFKLLPCPNTSNGGTVSHSNRRNKYESTFIWKAPDSCPSGHNVFTIRATIVQRTFQFQTGLTKELQCRPLTAARLTMNYAFSEINTPALQPRKEDFFCHYAAFTSVPTNKYKTSFERENEYNGWINNGWTRNSGRTPSKKTGPNNATDGSYYLYFETSGFRIGHTVTLQTDKDLQGCFCLTLKENYNVRKNTRHRFEIKAGNKKIYSVTKKNINWKQLKLQLDTPNSIKIQLIGIRGKNSRGDMAIDDVAVKAGVCD